MDLAALCPLPLGIIRWRAPEDALTVVVKGTFDLGAGQATLSETQEPLSGDRPGRVRGRLAHASDFVPMKARADVLLVGHARSEEPLPVIPFRFAIGELERQVFAMAAEPCTSIPLAPEYLRVAPRPDARQVAVGPHPSWVVRPLLGTSAQAELIGPSGITRGPLHADFDFGLFNVAPIEHQVASIREDAHLLLERLLECDPQMEVRLPGLRPKVFLVGPGAHPTQELPLQCDTLVVDTDRASCTLTWRGASVLDPARGEPSLIVLALEEKNESLAWADVLGRIFTAARGKAAEPPEDELPSELMTTKDRWGDETTRAKAHMQWASGSPLTMGSEATPNPGPLRGPPVQAAPSIAAPESAAEETSADATFVDVTNPLGSDLTALSDPDLSDDDRATGRPPPPAQDARRGQWSDVTQGVDRRKVEVGVGIPFKPPPRDHTPAPIPAVVDDGLPFRKR